jgi:hypothetical protein
MLKSPFVHTGCNRYLSSSFGWARKIRQEAFQQQMKKRQFNQSLFPGWKKGLKQILARS